METGSLTTMSNLNFQEMSREELKKYIRTHPTDDEAIRELFVNRRNPNAKRYPYPYDMPSEEIEAIFKEKLDRAE
jgi:SOS response regulatory protein OraA/RecX